ncbi:hypothetical protein [Paenibacillus sacheonensis]|uniref:Uncharacterized protein n=1 Tax=Paenibacillus sacheonensis TaxID=742054 RepID=A0A7X5C2N3_9BACL|nr:hypothetical protein [Paenibacillus sacheonensis]MBM7566361.1 hypothetical protein [Paenibacillus sacheonensis]NBC70564.1 hypothetical protein [Paenibacillus sacheonensis]
MLLLVAFAVMTAGCGELPSGNERSMAAAGGITQSSAPINEQDILTVRLQCTNECTRMGKPPFTEKRFESADEINVFVQVINHSPKIEGDMDYSTLFLMYLTFIDGTEKVFALNVSDLEGAVGLLVKIPGSSEGYAISEEFHRQLRTLIYHS